MEYPPMKHKNKTLSCLNVTRWLNIESSTVKTISNTSGYYVQCTKYSVFSVVNFPTKPYVYNVFFEFAMVLVSKLIFVRKRKLME